MTVYPRPRGGTCIALSSPPPSQGLSPPTRGNPSRLEQVGRRAGSIPAHAGEPTSAIIPPFRLEVYPRPRGGTRLLQRGGVPRPGLSPPTRGNPGDERKRTELQRSIPAHAGEPKRTESSKRTTKVYPRPRGGTVKSKVVKPKPSGLSPPTRGNPCKHEPRRVNLRSIPAHAGEPSSPRGRRTSRRVYPRPRGGTAGRVRDGLD